MYICKVVNNTIVDIYRNMLLRQHKISKISLIIDNE